MVFLGCCSVASDGVQVLADTASSGQGVILGLESTPLFLSFVFYALCVSAWEFYPE